MATTTIIFYKNIPELYLRKSISKTIKHFIDHAIEKSFYPVPIEKKEKLIGYPVYINQEDSKRYDIIYALYAHEYPTRAAYLSAMANAGYEDKIMPEPNIRLETLPEIGDRTWRTEQLIMLNNMRDPQRGKKTALIEASTGSGKGLAIMAHALTMGKTNDPVFVSSPTLNTLRQLYAEGLHITKANYTDNTPMEAKNLIAIVLGSQEFISSKLLASFLQEAELTQKDKENINQWIEKNLWDRESFEALDIKANATNFCVQYTDTSDITDSGVAAYREQITDTANASVILISHSMLARDTLSRISSTSEYKLDFAKYESEAKKQRRAGKRLPPYFIEDNKQRVDNETETFLPSYSMLIVDEAHLLSKNFTIALSEKWCIRSMRNRINSEIKPSAAFKKSQKTFNAFYRELCALPADIYIENTGEGDNPTLHRALKQIEPSLKTITRLTKDPVLKNHASGLLAKLTQIKRLQGLKINGGALVLNNTPIRKYPIIEAPTPHINKPLHYLWLRTTHSVATSATLFLPRKGDSSLSSAGRFMSEQLCIEQPYYYEPITPKWVFNTPSVYFLPETHNEINTRSYLQPPKLKKDGSIDVIEHTKWTDEVGSICAEIVENTPKGGTLILATSYVQASEISSVIKEITGTPIFTYEKSKNFEQLQTDFMKSIANGGSAIFVATGKAWTGTNISFNFLPAERDNAINNLIITRLPFGVERNIYNTNKKIISQQNNSSNNGFQYSLNEMLIVLKQGVGRLVRRPGMINKSIYIIDRRSVKVNEFKYSGAVKSLFDNYENISELNLKKL